MQRWVEDEEWIRSVKERGKLCPQLTRKSPERSYPVVLSIKSQETVCSTPVGEGTLGEKNLVGKLRGCRPGLPEL